jgi:hypothetical protein
MNSPPHAESEDFGCVIIVWGREEKRLLYFSLRGVVVGFSRSALCMCVRGDHLSDFASL